MVVRDQNHTLNDESYLSVMLKYMTIYSIIFKNIFSTTSLLLFIYVGLVLINEVFIYYIGMLPSVYLVRINEMKKDKAFRVICILTIIVFIIVFISSIEMLLLQFFEAKSRKNLTNYLHRLFLENNRFYYMNIMCKHFHSDHSIVYNSHKICHYIRKLLKNILGPCITALFYTFAAISVSGYINTLLLYVYFSIYTVLVGFISRPLLKTTFSLECQEGDFRYTHFNKKEYAEEYTLLNSYQTDYNILKKKLYEIIESMYKIAIQKCKIQCFAILFNYVTPILFFTYNYYNTIYYYKNTEKYAQNRIAYLSVGIFYAHKIIISFTSIVSNIYRLTLLKAHIYRVIKLLEIYYIFEEYHFFHSLDNSNKLLNDDSTLTFSSIIEWKSTELIIIENLKLYIPTTNKFIGGGIFNFTIKKLHNLGITGPNGCGKTTLLRYICSIWPPIQGKIHKSFELNHPNAILVFLSFNYHSNLSSIYEKLFYPNYQYLNELSFYNEADRCLTLVGLNYLIPSSSNLNINILSEIQLSSGEQQRLMFAKILLFKPTLAIIDELTFALPLDVSISLYNLCIDAGVTFITATQNCELLKQTHHSILNMTPIDHFFEQPHK